MSRILIYIAFLIFLSSCIGKHKSNADAVKLEEKQNPVETFADKKTEIDLNKSKIHWKGTKMRGAGKHEGEIKLKAGYLLMENDKLVGGNFVADMQTINVTDIPEHEPIPRRNLNNHLKSDDFFAVERFPISKFEIIGIEQLASDSLLVTGNLHIKDTANSIEFVAVQKLNSTEKSLHTRFTFNRFDWYIAYKGNWADKTLVDKEIELTIDLIF